MKIRIEVKHSIERDKPYCAVFLEDGKKSYNTAFEIPDAVSIIESVTQDIEIGINKMLRMNEKDES